MDINRFDKNRFDKNIEALAHISLGQTEDKFFSVDPTHLSSKGGTGKLSKKVAEAADRAWEKLSGIKDKETVLAALVLSIFSGGKDK